MSDYNLDTLSSLSRDHFKDNDLGRQQALDRARALCRRLETPWESLVREIWMAPSTTMGIKLAQDSGIFLALIAKDGQGQTATQIAETSKCEIEFTRRILRIVTAAGYVEEADEGVFRSTELTKTFMQPGYVGGISHLYSQILPTFLKLPGYFTSHGYVTPRGQQAAPFQYCTGSSEPFFDWIMARPQEAKAFGDTMAVYHEQRAKSWIEIYPPSELTKDIAKPPGDSPLVVDVGGGMGHDMEILRKALQPQEYCFVVQDRKGVVERAPQPHANVRLEAHDFFTPQPIHGARAYFLHTVLHNWADEAALQVLNHLKAAMRPGYSRLLICENMLPARSRFPYGGSVDLIMMALFGAKDRPESDWRDLLKDAGLRVIKVWGDNMVGQCVIEAELE